MRKFRIVFFNVPNWKYYRRHPVALGIALASWSRIIHVELWTPDEHNRFWGEVTKFDRNKLLQLRESEYWNLLEEHGFSRAGGFASTFNPAENCREFWLIGKQGRCWTSTLRGDDDGACVRPASKVLHNPGRWTYKEFECSDEDYDNMIEAMEYAVATNAGYDKKLIRRWWMRRVYDKTKYVCSEYVMMAMLAVNNGYMLGYMDRTNEVLNPAELAAILPGKMVKMGYELKPLGQIVDAEAL